MTSLAHLVGMIYDLKTEVERQKMNQSLCDADESTGKLLNSITLSDSDYKISLDVSAFQQEEITVKVKEHEIIVCGEHEERQDEFGFVARQLKRRFILPDIYDADTISSTLGDDGKLTIKAEKKKTTIVGGDRFIPIQHLQQ